MDREALDALRESFNLGDWDDIRRDIGRSGLVALFDYAERMRAALEWIASQENLTFAECSLAEEIVRRAKAAIES